MKINIQADIPDRWVNAFLSTLKRMEVLGNIGATRIVGINSDGDGDFRPKFEFDTKFETVDSDVINDAIIFDAG